MKTPYKIEQIRVGNAALVANTNQLSKVRNDLVNKLKNSDRDFDKMKKMMEEYVQLFEANDLMLGYAIMPLQGERQL